jgi:hypothetical protein
MLWGCQATASGGSGVLLCFRTGLSFHSTDPKCCCRHGNVGSRAYCLQGILMARSLRQMVDGLYFCFVSTLFGT